MSDAKKTEYIKLKPSDFMSDIKKTDDSEIHPLYPMLKGMSESINEVKSEVRDVKHCVLGNPAYKVKGLVDEVEKHSEDIERHHTILESINKKILYATAWVGGACFVVGVILHVLKIL